ncbi:hypothetical protein I4U23_016044 [Adineta vaga]|nr:hypothetical protein I4U23_016044 [Adineta vaga]
MSSTNLISQLNSIRLFLPAYYLPFIFVFGIVGNCLSIIIFTRNHLRMNVISWYFICLSFNQIGFLLYNCLYRIITLGWSNGYDLAGTNSFLCKFRSYGFILFLALSRHFLCLISIDRLMKTSRLASIRQKTSPPYARWYLKISFTFWILFCLHGPIGYQSTSNSGCTSMTGDYYQLFYTIHTICIGIIPFSIMLILCLLLLKVVRQRNRVIHGTNLIGSTNNQISCIQPRRIKDIQFIRLSIIQSFVFLIFTSISSGYPLYSYLTSSISKTLEQRTINSFISDLGLYLVHTYMSLTFVIYILVSSTFRKELIRYFLTIENSFRRMV